MIKNITALILGLLILFAFSTIIIVDETEQIVGDEIICVPNTTETEPEELSCKNNEKVIIKNGIPECALKTGDKEEQEQCPVGTEQCVVITDNTKTSGGQGGINLTGGSDTSDSDYLLFGAIGVLVLGLMAFIIKRRN